MSAIAAKIEDEQSLGSKMQKQVKELAVSLVFSFSIIKDIVHNKVNTLLINSRITVRKMI